MSDYAIKNLKDLDDAAAERTEGRMEARFARSHLDSQQLGISFFGYDAGFRSPVGHRHREQEEAYVVVAGSGRVKLGDEIHELRQWDVVRVAPPVARAFEAGPDGLQVIAIGGTKPEGGDGEMLKDFWAD